MTNLFYTSDQHFFHRNILKYTDRPWDSAEEMNEALIDAHNSVVKKGDNIIICGDFSYGKREETFEIINRLNGNKIFLRGNHDKWMKKSMYHEIDTRKYLDQYIVACHYQMLNWPQSHFGAWNLYGHSHGQSIPRLNQLEIGVDCHPDFAPFAFEEIKSIIDGEKWEPTGV